MKIPYRIVARNSPYGSNGIRCSIGIPVIHTYSKNLFLPQLYYDSILAIVGCPITPYRLSPWSVAG